MLLGKPIIATKTSGARELLDNGEFGIMVDNSEDGIYFGIKKIIENRELIDSYSKLSKVRSANFFSVSSFMEKLKLLLDE